MTDLRRSRLNFLVLLTGLVGTGPVLAEASLFIYPTLVMFEGRQRSAEVTIANRGDETGTFEVGWSDMSMTPEGGLVRHDEQQDWSVQPFVRYSPRRVTLAPSESQVIKIALRPDDMAKDGEYYSHMRVLTINSESLLTDAGDAPDAAPGVSIATRTAIAIPVVWRNSDSVSAATIESLTLDHGSSEIAVDVRRDGLLSVRGYLHVLDLPAVGKITQFAEPVPLIMYPSVDRRSVTFPLRQGVSFADLPPGVAVYFAADEILTENSTIYAARPIFSEQ